MTTYTIEEELLQDLDDFKFHTGESKSSTICKAIRYYMSRRVRNIKPTSIAAERLLARYGSLEG
jgi:hypothetical protein